MLEQKNGREGEILPSLEEKLAASHSLQAECAGEGKPSSTALTPRGHPVTCGRASDPDKFHILPEQRKVTSAGVKTKWG
jgi:hypothetical protein